MKKIFSCLFFLFLLAVSFGGCATRLSDTDSSDWTLSAEPEFVTSWPENEFTSWIPKPSTGSIDYVCDYTDSGRYQVVMKDLSQEESQDYVHQLLEQGYEQIASESNEASAGTILQKDEVTLSIAYSENVLNILIIVNDADS